MTAESISGSAPGGRGAPVAAFTKGFTTCDPVPAEGIERAVEVMRQGSLFRYDFPGELLAGGGPAVLGNGGDGPALQVAMLEREFARYLRREYVIAVNSCGSAIFLALKAAGAGPGDPVLTNAFTFTAVPSAIVHAGATPVFVECTADYVIDLDDLRLALRQHPNAKCVVLSYMRGHVPDPQAVQGICDEAGIMLIEDCAHSLGATWDGRPVGYHGKLACFSTQSYKMLNSGEGGLIATDDEELAAYCVLAAGCYEKLYTKHLARPPGDALFEKLKPQVPNFSLRMSNLTAAVLRPQLPTLDDRIAGGRDRYRRLAEVIGSARNIRLPAPAARLERAPDSLQFTLVGLTADEVDVFVQQTGRRGVPIQIFGRGDNARYFRNWRYSFTQPPALDATEAIISSACDLRLPSSLDPHDLKMIGHIIKDVLYQILAERQEQDYPGGLTDHFGGIAEVQRTYDAWAPDYDCQHHDNGWMRLLNHLAYTLKPHLNDGAAVLDVGCGTGLLGRELRSYGFGNLQGLDISPASLDRLADQGLYKDLHLQALGGPLSFADSSFGGLVSAGVFTRNQVPLDSFGELVRILRPGGIFAVVLRVEDDGLYEAPIASLCAQGAWREVLRERVSVLRSCSHDLVILQKAPPPSPLP